MKNLIKISLILLILASAAWPQSDSGLKRNLQNLKRKLDNLERLAVKYRADNVLLLVQKAKLELTGAVYQYNQGNFRKALELYRNAVKDADRAAKLLLIRPLAAAKNEFDRLIQRAERAVQGSEKAEARHMLVRARSFHTKAVRAYNNTQFVQAQEFQRIATYFANKAIILADVEVSGSGRKSDYNEQLENLKRLYKNITSSNTSNPNITRLIEKAFSYFQASKYLFEQGDEQQALFRLQIGERLLYRALDLQQTSSEGRNERLRLNIASLRNYIDGVERTLNDSQKNGGTRMLRKARQFYQSALRDYESGNFVDAQSKISLSQRMATRALQAVSSEPETDLDLIRDKIKEIEQIIKLQRQKLTAENPLVNILHEQAETLLKNAKTAVEGNRGRQAFWMVRFVFRIVNRAEFILKNSGAEQIDNNKLQQDLSRLRQTLLTLEQNDNLNKPIKIQVNFLNNLIQKAEKSINENNLYAAAELVKLAQQHLNFLLKEALN